MKTLSFSFRRLTELPGPVWLFCGLCLEHMYNWTLQLGTQLCDGRLQADSSGIDIVFWFSSLLQSIFYGMLVWGYVARKHFAVPLAAWYTGFTLIRHFSALLVPFSTGIISCMPGACCFPKPFPPCSGAGCVLPICAIWSVPKQWRVCIRERIERSAGGSCCFCSSSRYMESCICGK